MKRRSFIKTGLAAGAGVACASDLLGSTMLKSGKKPNVLIIYTDQHSCWTLGSYGGTLVKTPYIDSIAKDGARLDNFYTNAAVCTPSRGCFMSGMYPEHNGAVLNDIPIRQDIESVAHMFKKHGYQTGYAGKWHLDGKPKPGFVPKDRSIGFDDCSYMFNRGHWKKITEPGGKPKVFGYKEIGDEESYTTDWLADKTVDFINQDHNDPFFYMVSIPDPHSPLSVRAPYDTMYKPEDMVIPKTFNADWLPSWIKSTPYGKNSPNREERVRKGLAQYCGMVKCIDDNVGKIMDALKQKGILDDTVVIFTCDHGEYLGEHGGLFGKNNFYQNAYRIPFLIRYPDEIEAGTVVKHHVTTVDVKQTLAGLVGLKTNGQEQGYDASPLLRNKKVNVEDVALVSRQGRSETGGLIGLYNTEWSICYSQSGKDHLLYDMKNDPHQEKNLFYDKQYAKIKKQLTDKLVELCKKNKRNATEWLPKVM